MKFDTFNKALLGKWLWRFGEKLDSWWCGELFKSNMEPLLGGALKSRLYLMVVVHAKVLWAFQVTLRLEFHSVLGNEKW